MSRKLKLLLLGLLTLAALPAPTLLLEPTGEGAVFRYRTSEPAVLARSTAQLRPVPMQGGNLPIRRLALPGTEGEFVDTQMADNTAYCYRLELGDNYSQNVVMETPNFPLPPLVDPDILIDKVNFYLEVRDQGVPVKRYPISMGSRCDKRKVCLDRASTPEGRYRISHVQPETDFYRAYDVNYPTRVDTTRYQFYRRHGLLPEETTPIGGDIQIHGQGWDPAPDWNIYNNWTWGCIAMRNPDLDELFADPAVGVGTPLTIVGQDMTREDLAAIDRVDPAALLRALRRELGPGARCDAETLGCWQMKHHLPVTCQADARTQRALGILAR